MRRRGSGRVLRGAAQGSYAVESKGSGRCKAFEENSAQVEVQSNRWSRGQSKRDRSDERCLYSSLTLSSEVARRAPSSSATSDSSFFGFLMPAEGVPFVDEACCSPSPLLWAEA